LVTAIPWLPFLTLTQAISLSHSYYRPTLGVFFFHSLFLYLDMPPPPPPSFLLAQAGFEPNLYLYKYPSNLTLVILSAYTTYEDGAECSETSAHNIQILGIYPYKKYSIAIAHRWQHLLSCGDVPDFHMKRLRFL
jgi:hypothetical protein